MDFTIDMQSDKIILALKTLIKNETQTIILDRPISKPQSWPVHFWTATTDIKDFIGNIKTILPDGKCDVDCLYRGEQICLQNVVIKDKSIKRIGQRVMLTEHININGEFEIIATIKRIISLEKSGLNFINIGWSDTIE